jgi:hypothetical protein
MRDSCPYTCSSGVTVRDLFEVEELSDEVA